LRLTLRFKINNNIINIEFNSKQIEIEMQYQYKYKYEIQIE